MATTDLSDVLARAFTVAPDPTVAFTREGMALTELEILERLVREQRASTALEIGMAYGTSTIAMLHGMNDGTLTSIDPGQTSYYGCKGVEHVRLAGVSDRHTLIEAPDYVALPRLLEQGAQFDAIFIDGWHSTDFVMLDLFYADLLLRDGGLLALHDTNAPPVYAGLQFLERSKPYTRIGPPAYEEQTGLLARVRRRLTHAVGARAEARRLRQSAWRTLTAYRKERSEMTPQYPHR